MLWTAIVVAALALIFALAAWAKAAGFARELEDAKLETRRVGSALREELERSSTTTRELLAALAEGSRPTREMILEGRLWRDVDAREAERLLADGGVRVLDVRSPAETAGGVLPGALLIPIEELERRASELPKDGARTLVYCAAGGRSAAACEFLSTQGWTELYNLAGGVGAWKGPLERPGRHG
jgi:rhodanese-related sulfurtransferase